MSRVKQLPDAREIVLRASPPTPDWKLLYAAGMGDLALTQEALAAGANPNATRLSDANRITSLQLAAAGNFSAIVSCLLAAGAELNAQDRYRRTALHRAAEHGNFEAVQVLLAADADTSLRDENGCTATDLAGTRNRFAYDQQRHIVLLPAAPGRDAVKMAILARQVRQLAARSLQEVAA